MCARTCVGVYLVSHVPFLLLDHFPSLCVHTGACSCGVATLENCKMCRMLCGRIASDAGLCHQPLSVVSILYCIERLLLYSNSQPVIGTSE